ncbi:TPA: hypothetical protein JDC63_000861 [Salmonella enterica subsp. arizonae]|nr:hypothetical protein [Salmonella enterica subsp. arizonae]
MEITSRGMSFSFPDGSTTKQIGDALDGYFLGPGGESIYNHFDSDAKSWSDKPWDNYQEGKVQTVALPNGVELIGVPRGTPWLKVAEHSIDKGYAKPEDFHSFSGVCWGLRSDGYGLGCVEARYKDAAVVTTLSVVAVLVIALALRVCWRIFGSEKLKLFSLVCVECLAAILVGMVGNSALGGVILFLGLETLRTIRVLQKRHT